MKKDIYKKRSTKREVEERKYFNRIALTYDKNYGYKDKFTEYKINKKCTEFVNFVTAKYGKKSLRILEIGCGTGEYTKAIASRLPQSSVVALDISEKIIKVARRKCAELDNVSFITKNAYSTGFKKGTFDVVCGYYVLHHLYLTKINIEIARVLKPGGIAFFYEPNILNPVVYLIKSTPYLKKKAGDSKDEWAINPLTLGGYFAPFEVNVSMTEFIWPLKVFSLPLLIRIDKVFSLFGKLPIVKYLGGSVQIRMKKQ
ncbi:class I SAM-dependent methyltransferase [Patescibacteria group bacterium]|nr:class I SAM-dependent methyltransferase [Patescibacteria group bacterium]MBU0777368.1 class I SAM-dependent methyltransferase [Patescibacteria group bacterium]MBU0845996.1 class I SAM-dependent methyltransferase [Patescibacteria group bacterium]MBU0922545.1 class I SAM-dependent methyltransferase [Patescibacteria group bacterium]MBU1066522.1 class I SAM-dependent methyltransferase [Patescibacteria group bacterium]